MGDITEVLKQIKESVAAKRGLEPEAILRIVKVLSNAFRGGKKVLLCGNGGSATEAQHLASELTGKFYLHRPSLPAIALTDNSSSLTAIANDYGYDSVFSHQLQGLVNEGDVVIGISTSGNSINVILALEEAKRHKAITVAFTSHGGKLGEIADYIISVPSKCTPRIQEAHMTAAHIICYFVENELFGDRDSNVPESDH